jgi:hypothetical protein
MKFDQLYCNKNKCPETFRPKRCFIKSVPVVWSVEDQFGSLQTVLEHLGLRKVGAFSAEWGDKKTELKLPAHMKYLTYIRKWGIEKQRRSYPPTCNK